VGRSPTDLATKCRRAGGPIYNATSTDNGSSPSERYKRPYLAVVTPSRKGRGFHPLPHFEGLAPITNFSVPPRTISPNEITGLSNATPFNVALCT